MRDELAQTRQMLADAQRLTKTGSWIIDPVGGGASGSVECYRILGLPGKTSSAHFMECLSNVHPDDLPAVLEGFQQSIATGEPRPLHYRIVAGDGSTTDIETVAQPVCDEIGHVVSVVGTVMDVTERNRVQEALRASEKLARGQLGALTRTLDALVQEASPDRLMEVVLRTIAGQFDAATITVWLTVEGSAFARFNFQFINDRLFTVADAPHPAARMSPEAQNNPVWRQILATKRPEICADIRSNTDVPFRDYNLSLGTVTILVVPMLIAGDVAGLLAIGFRERRDLHFEEIELAQALANQAMLALQLTRLSDQSRQAAVMAERNRVVRDVHDTLAHAFTGVIVQLEASDDASARGLDAEAGAHIARAEAMAREGLQEARRSVMALRPQVLERNDLSTALREMVTGMTDGTSVNSEFAQGGVPRELPPSWDEHLLRIGQEALTNAIRHGLAQRIVMELDFSDDAVLLRLTDDGRGFDANSAFDGLGLAGMRARVSSMGGQLSIRSAAGSGTTISVSVPECAATSP
ncbi:MAG TPA: ATP-binding protein [Gemmatimonadaceae bacterium]|nr:ATP-binding protein [Gemmatimonadaceae bacterium]